jgi:hypothetical protein
MNVRPYRGHKLAESAAHYVALKDDYLGAGPAG